MHEHVILNFFYLILQPCTAEGLLSTPSKKRNAEKIGFPMSTPSGIRKQG